MKLITTQVTATTHTVQVTDNDLKILLCALGRTNDKTLRDSSMELNIPINTGDTTTLYQSIRDILKVS
jgi:hypothetical protein